MGNLDQEWGCANKPLAWVCKQLTGSSGRPGCSEENELIMSVYGKKRCFLALNLWSFYFIFYLCVCGYLFVCVPHESHTCKCRQRPEEHLGFSGTEVTMSGFTCGNKPEAGSSARTACALTC